MTIFPDPYRYIAVASTKQEQALETPRMYKIILLDDDFTPMDFVVMILERYFNKDRITATQIMLNVHISGRGICGVYTRDIAMTKIEQVITHTRKAGYPLQCVMEET
jgi:ATP-dependent Clp protease adaptor protein ClpS